MSKDSDKLHLEEYHRLETLLKPMDSFVAAHPELTYIQFDYLAVHDLTLFTVEPDIDFAFLTTITDKVLASMPAIKRIFGKPIINLKDNDDVLPVETVRVINQATMQHLANHATDVANLTAHGVKPQKLLTQIYEDDYGIYENLIFCNFIDETIRYARHNMAYLRNLVYAKEILEFNLLERVNHINYFLTIGKLHMGYIRDFDKYYSVSKKLYTKLQAVINAIQPRLVKPVYKNNKLRNPHLPLKKTNIFLMQKDYHQVYVLYKWMLNRKPSTKEEAPVDMATLKREYFSFVEALLIFAVGNFNFEIPEETKMHLAQLDATFAYKGWSLEIKNVANEGLLLKVSKERSYSVLLVPDADFDLKDPLAYFGPEYGADETIVCTPFEKEPKNGLSFISMEDVESFRRLQQIVLRAMIYSDVKKDQCPFCSNELSYDAKNNDFACDNCRTEIHEGHCVETGKAYFYTTIGGSKRVEINRSDFGKDEQWLYNRKVESLMHFRNITPINEKGEVVCPLCGKVHKEENKN
jgi:hypothetical protein